MNKEFYFNLDQAQCDWAFKPIRTKTDVIEILMRALKTISVYTDPTRDKIRGQLKLHISKMSRIFFFSEEKYYSLAFPFILDVVGDEFVFRSTEVESVDSFITSKVLSVINDPSYINSSLWAFFEPLLDLEEQQTIPGFWPFFKMLLTYEDGYIRYDIDDVRENGKLHPLYHFDVFYSNHPTFKIGLNQHYTNDEMIDFLNRETDCWYLK
ncbi:hypothetical protein AAIB78_001629 [Morganella morganii]